MSGYLENSYVGQVEVKAVNARSIFLILARGEIVNGQVDL